MLLFAVDLSNLKAFKNNLPLDRFSILLLLSDFKPVLFLCLVFNFLLSLPGLFTRILRGPKACRTAELQCPGIWNLRIYFLQLHNSINRQRLLVREKIKLYANRTVFFFNTWHTRWEQLSTIVAFYFLTILVWRSHQKIQCSERLNFQLLGW